MGTDRTAEICLLIHERAWTYPYETATADRAQAWMKYLEGEWTYKVSDGVEAEAKWTFEAGRQAMIGRFREGDTTGIEMGGWQPNTALCVVTGYGSKGDSWRIEYRQLSGADGRGVIRGTMNNKEYSGDFSATVIDDDQWGWTIDGKTSDGEKVRLSATFQRKQS